MDGVPGADGDAGGDVGIGGGAGMTCCRDGEGRPSREDPEDPGGEGGDEEDGDLARRVAPGSAGVGTSMGTVLHSGHDARPRSTPSSSALGRPLLMSHSSMHCLWKRCWHGSRRSSSPAKKGSMHTEQST